MSGTAPVAWAQRKDSVYFTIKLPDVKEPKIELEGTTLKFRSVEIADAGHAGAPHQPLVHPPLQRHVQREGVQG